MQSIVNDISNFLTYLSNEDLSILIELKNNISIWQTNLAVLKFKVGQKFCIFMKIYSMDIPTEILVAFKQLTSQERKALLKLLYKETETLNTEGNYAKYCPHCQSNSITKYGMQKGEQRFKCADCDKIFKETTGTVLDGIRNKALFLKFQDAMINEEYCPIVKMAKRFGISAPTAFSWRHKILISLPKLDGKFEDETQIDDVWIRYSQKGRKGLEYGKKRGSTSHKGDSNFQVKILTATNGSQTEMKVSNIGRLSKADIQRSLGDKISKKTILISDKHRSIEAFAKENKIEHHSFKASEHVTRDGKGVQLLNNIASRLDTLLNRTFCGVSTKYLQLYVNWFKYRENNKNNTKQIVLQDEILSKKYSWDLFSNIEKVYGNFIKNHSVRTYRCPQLEKFKAQIWNQKVIFKYSFL
jgi:transposase-like protein